jgi:hypothetical protein
MKLDKIDAPKPYALKLYSLAEDIATPAAIIATVISVVIEYRSPRNTDASTSDETGSADFTVSTNEAFTRLNATFVNMKPIVYDPDIFAMSSCCDPFVSGVRAPFLARIKNSVVTVAIQNWLKQRVNGSDAVCINILEVVIVTAEEVYHRPISEANSTDAGSSMIVCPAYDSFSTPAWRRLYMYVL